MKRFIFLLGTVTICLASTCKHPIGVEVFPKYRLWIQNNSSDSIVSLISKIYPDTTIPDSELESLLLTPGTRRSYDSSEEWSNVFLGLPADTLSIFFYHYDTLSKYGFKNIRENYNILKRKDISFVDLKNNGYTVTYP